MRISKAWLSDYIDLSDLSDADFSELITTRVAEVDSVEEVASALRWARIGYVESVAAHPSKKSLKVVQVSLGAERVQVICGAENCRQGLCVAYMPPGGTIYTDTEGSTLTVALKSFDGVESCGVLLSERELGISNDHAGILEITPEYVAGGFRKAVPADIKAGTLLADYIGGPDTVIEIDNKSLTHRPDLWGHFGFVRELHALLSRPILDPLDRYSDAHKEGEASLAQLGSGKANFKVEIDPNCGCRRFAVVELANVKAATSPIWMRRRLYAVGAGVRNCIVDLSNYVMHDVGQPNHTYDADRLQGSTVRIALAREGESFVGLDENTYQLSTEDLAVYDSAGPATLGGVMGGQSTAITSSTVRVLLEAANWDPVRVRKTSVRQALRTDASNRFEKSLSAYLVPVGLLRYTELLREIQPDIEVRGEVVDAFPERPQPISVTVRSEYIRERLGHAVTDEQIKGILTKLGFAYSGADTVHVPYYRATRDISIEDDFVEEIGRTVGYENIPAVSPLIESVAEYPRPVQQAEHAIRDNLAASGFSEAYLYSFMNSELAEEMGYATEKQGEGIIRLENPVDATQDVIRTTLVPGLIRAVSENARHEQRVLLFEIGRAYSTKRSARHAELASRKNQKNTVAEERRLLTLAYSSGLAEKNLRPLTEPVVSSGMDFYCLAGVVKRLLAQLTSRSALLETLAERAMTPVEASELDVLRNWMHPQRAAQVVLDGETVGVIAEVKPRFRGECKSRIVVAELDIELIVAAILKEKRYQPFSRFPTSYFEMSVVVPQRETYRTVESLVRSAVPGDLLKGLEPLAVYAGEPIADGYKSVSVGLTFGSDTGTLNSEEIESLQQRCMQVVENSSFSLRR